MDTLQPFNNIFIGTELQKAINMYPSEASMPENLAKIKDIAEFLNAHQDPMLVIDKVKNNKTSMKNIDFLFGYVHLNKQKQEMSKKMEELDKQIKSYE